MINIENKSNCSGCYACANVCPKNCIELISDEEGFFYPKINFNSCTNCNKCSKICPIINQKHNNIKRTPIAYAAYNKDEKTRIKSSSGGIFTLIAEYVLSKNGIVFGACFDDDFNLKHDYTEEISGLEKFRGSKYVQSSIGDTYSEAKKFLELNRLVLFTGTPCQIGGLYSYLGKDYNNLITHDIICHGVPSPKIWKKYILFREEKANSAVRNVSFRCKDKGWNKFSIYFDFKNNTSYKEIFLNDLSMIAFLQNIDLRPSCYKCSFKNINRQADITLADFWCVKNILPQMDDDKGTSLLIINSEKGNDLFNILKNQIVYNSTDLISAIKFNPAMCKSPSRHKNRKYFFKNIDIMKFDFLVKKYCKPSRFNKFSKSIRKVVSKIKKIVMNIL